jgi:CheY-like chemotaxis protein
VAAATHENYTLVLMDIQMPRMDGFAAAAAIRAGGGPEAMVPIIAYTALHGPAFEAKMRAAGIDGHMRKPCTQEALIALVERWGITSASHPGARLGAIFGEEEIAGLLARFRERLAAVLEASADPVMARADAHGIAGIAGTLGFSDLHAHWLALSEGDDSALERARAESRKTLLLLDREGDKAPRI